MTAILMILSLLAFAGCTSPETTRSRGGGAGADIGNRGAYVRMHEGSKPFENTPTRIPSKHPPLGPAEQAYERERR
jgi:hypothetical protein